ncbi:hypothetical protein ASPSYDRAFT_60095 [Aspergillus sydowii CBS 593.65]|uniref:Rhodopsin domain-containing protein n=1 Tax=Aspergillus sydowii CBS 593.65 TaxID=1036612 RepID=A0A1L9T941_9EURO|nr:uncharacterized protein ASPSYDRAFT_60095 [Aspergillus sydowii CBS 593.65]OJJ55947.1 hypothetical protein ASPSYDRAFT_60095 [Aspergillus sydowii CBS 593.65]
MTYNLTAELFAEWALGILVAGVRIYTRCFIDNRNLYWDDMVLILGLIFWTVMTVTLYLCTAVYSSNIGLNAETALQIPDSEVGLYKIGSVCAFVAWLAYILAVWAFKGVLVFLYTRLTMGLWQHRLSLMVGALTAGTFLVSLIFDLAICHPIHKNWQVKPYAGDNCTIRPMNYIVIEVLSIVTDLAVMCVPIPLIIVARIPTSQKLILAALFCSGIFVMICAILRAYYSVTQIDTLATALGWASRECFVSVFIVCAPGIKPLFTRFRWFRTYGSSNGYTNSNTKSRGTGKMVFSTKNSHNFNTLVSAHEREPYEMGPAMGWKKGGRKGRGSSDESQEHIISSTPDGKGDGLVDGMGIRVTTDVHLALHVVY